MLRRTCLAGFAAVGAVLAAAPAALAEGEGHIPLTTASEEAREAFKNAQYALDHGRQVEAHELASEAVALDPNFAYGWLIVANSSFSAQEYGESLAAGLAAEGASDGERLLLEQAETYITNDGERRIALGEELTAAYPDSMRAWVARANGEGSLNRHDEARASLTRAAEVAPESALPPTALGFSYLFNDPKDFDQAAARFAAASELEPGEDNHHVNLGDAYRAQNDLDASRAAYLRALELNDTNSLAAIKKGHVNSFLGNYDEAVSDFDAAIALAGAQNEAYYANFRAFTWVHAGDIDRAVTELEAVLASIEAADLADSEKAGARGATYGNLITIGLHNGRYDEVEGWIAAGADNARAQAEAVGDEAFMRAVEANVAFNEGRLAARRGDYEAALAKAEEMAGLVEADSNPRRLENHHYLVGLTHHLQGDQETAIAHLEQADLTVLYQKHALGLALEAAGRADDARAIFQEIATNNFNSVDFALLRADAQGRVTGTAAE